MDLGPSFDFMSGVKTVVDSISLGTPLEVLEIITRNDRWVPHPDLVRQTIDRRLRERGVVSRLLMLTKWEISMSVYTYNHVSCIQFYVSNSAIY